MATRKKKPVNLAATRIYPPVRCPLEPAYEDKRGIIQNLLHGKFGSAVLITSGAGSVRAQHFHKRDTHHVYLLSGSMIYLCRPVGEDVAPTGYLVREGQMIFTPSGIEHSMHFLEPTAFLTLAKEHREPSAYDVEITRLQFPLDPGEAKPEKLDNAWTLALTRWWQLTGGASSFLT